MPGRQRLATALAVVLLLVAGCRDRPRGGEGDDIGVNLDLDAGEVRVVGDYNYPRPGAFIAMAVDPDGIIYFRLNTGTVVDAKSPSDVDSCCAPPDLNPGGVFVDDYALYVTHGDSTDPHRGVWRSSFAGGTEVVVDLPDERGQIPGDVAVGPDGEVIFTVRRVEEGSPHGVQVLRATVNGGLEVVAGAGQGCTTETTPAAEARFTSLVGLAVGGDGTVYVADEGCGAVYAVADGSVRVVVSADTDPGLGALRPVDVAVVGDDVYVADRRLGDRLVDVSPDDGRVLWVDAEGAVSVVIDDVGAEEEEDTDDDRFNLRDIRSLAVTPSGDLLVLDDDRVIGVGVGRE